MIADTEGPMCYIDPRIGMATISAQSCSLAGRTRGQRPALGRTLGRATALCAILLTAATQALHGQVPQALRVQPLVRDDRVHVTFELRDGFTRDVRAAIHSGLKTTFTYS